MPGPLADLTVREVLAHVIAGASPNPVRWLAGVIRCRFDFDKQVAMRLPEQLGTTPAETIDRFRSVLASTTKPPGWPSTTRAPTSSSSPMTRTPQRRTAGPRLRAIRSEVSVMRAARSVRAEDFGLHIERTVAPRQQPVADTESGEGRERCAFLIDARSHDPHGAGGAWARNG